MRKILLMTSAVVLFPLSTVAQTTCTASPDCASLGYTEASCPNGGVKCPWGDKWFCSSSETEICSKYGFKYTCTGTGYSGGSGTACEGKYASCTCTKGYEWKNGSCSTIKTVWRQCSGYAALCSLGDILFSDGTCNTNMVSGKTPIAVVVYKSDDGNCGQALALKSIGKYSWGAYGTDISTLPNYSGAPAASKDFASCKNSEIIITKAKGSAAIAANEYSTKGTNAGDWCLPAAGIFSSYYNNQNIINAGFDKAGGTKFTISTYAWSSSEYREYWAWYSYFGEYSNGLDHCPQSETYCTYIKGTSYEVRPVLEF